MSTIFFTYVKDPRIIAVRFLLIPVSLFYSEIDACFAFVDFSLHLFIVRGAYYYYSILLLTIIYYIILYYIQYYNTQNKVTIGMQGELIHAVSYIARAKYDPNMTQIATNATELKYNLSLALELLDGFLSLCVNAMAIMTTTRMLDIVLNFASLYFLQDIDQIGYELIEAGFFCRTMELRCHVVNRIELP